MLRSKLNKFRNDDEGFTLIELLVVILIIGILAAIALPSFLGQSDKAKDSSAKSNARNAVTQIESCLADGGDVAAQTACGTSANPDLAQFKNTVATSTAPGIYSVVSTSDSTATFTISKTAPGGYVRSCDKNASNGSCKGTGVSW